MDVDKMRRNIARSTPDRITKKFDPMDEFGVEFPVREFVDGFASKMKIKYGEDTQIAVYVDHDLAEFPGQVVVTVNAMAIPPRR